MSISWSGSRPVRLALVFYFVLYSVAAGPVSGALWARSAHLTLDQWGYHEVLNQSGYLNHHAAATGDQVQVSDAAPGTQIVVALLPSSMPILTVLTEPPFFSEGMPLVAASPVDLLTPPGAQPPSGRAGDRAMEGQRIEPPEKPPKVAS